MNHQSDGSAGVIIASLRICCSTILVAAFVPGVCRGQIARPKENPSAIFRSHAEGPIPNVDLPPQVIAPDGQVSLFADYANVTGNGIPLYLVNRTDQPVTTPSQDRDLIVKLDCKTADGFWQRAQSYLGSYCGTSSTPPTIPSGHHLKTLGYQAAQGTRGKVRYQLYLLSARVISNVGDGVWSEDDIQASYSDRINTVGQPIAEWLSVKANDNNQQDPSQRWQNIGNAITWLDLVSHWRTDGYFNYQIEMVQEAVKALVTSDSKESESALALLAEIASRKSPPNAEMEVLLQACINSIKSPANTDLKLGISPNRPLVAWKALKWLIEEEVSGQQLVPLDWNETFALIDSRFAAADQAEKEAMGGLFVSRKLVAEHVRTGFLLANVNSELPSISGMCVNYLAERQAYRQLAEIGLAGDMDLKMRILAAFCVSPGGGEGPRPLRRRVDDPVQKMFWESCLQADPWRSFYEMNSNLGLGYHDRLDLEPWLALLLRKEFKRLIEDAKQGVYPVTGLDQRWGIRYYVKTVLVDIKSDAFALLRSAVSLKDESPANEPSINFEARWDLVEAAGRELAIEEYFR